MNTRFLGTALIALSLLASTLGHADDNVKYSQCTNTFKEKSGIQSGTIIKLSTGEVFETLGSAFSFDKDLISPMCTIIKDKRFYYLLISGIGKKIQARKIN